MLPARRPITGDGGEPAPTAGATEMPQDAPTDPRVPLASNEAVLSDGIGSIVVKGADGWFETQFKSFRDRWNDLGEREYLRRLMLRTNNSTVQASREAGVDRTYLYRLLRRHDM